MTNINSGNNEIDDFLILYDDSLNFLDPEFDGSKLVLKLKSNSAEAKSTIESVFSEVNTLLGDSVEIKLSSSKIENLSFFFSAKDFLQKYDGIVDNFDFRYIIILGDRNNHTIKKPNQKYNDENKLIYNIHEYKQTLNYFLNTPEFTPYVSIIDNQFTLISKTFGVFNVGYMLPNIIFFQGLNLKGLSAKFTEQFEKKEFIQFFKEIVVTGVHNIPEENRFNEIIKQNNSLLNLAKRDYETYVSNFAFDKIKSEFKVEREKYFETIDRNLNSIGKQVISFPLTFGATVFASYKVKDQLEFLFFILVAYFLYTVIAFLILNITAYNVKCLRNDVSSEEEIIKKSYKVIYEGFEKDFNKIRYKILNLRIIIGALYFVLVLLLILFSAFTYYYIN